GGLGGDVTRGHSGGRGPQVGSGRLDGDQAEEAGSGRGVGGVRTVEAGQGASGRSGGGRRAADRECPSYGGGQGAGDRVVVGAGKSSLGLNPAEPVPPRIPAETKEALIKLIDDACARGWPHVRATAVLGVSDVRVHRWRTRLREVGTLVDRAPGGNPVHRLLGWEEDEILALIEQWGPTDRSHRKLAHRGSYLGKVWVAPSTVRRVAEKHQVRLPEPTPRR